MGIQGVSGAMSECYFCGQPSTDDQGLAPGRKHMECNDEYNRRRINGICIQCGVRNAVPEYPTLCGNDSCHDFEGYPP